MIRQDARISRNGSLGRVHDRVALTEPQWAIYQAGWDQTARFRVAVCGRRFGKALSTSTSLPSPGGWLTMGCVREGDYLFDERGIPCQVILATEIMYDRICWRVCFNDGLVIIADDEHLWRIKTGLRSMVHTTGQLKHLMDQDQPEEYMIPACLALQMPEQEWSENPYRTGLLAMRRGTLGRSGTAVTGSVRQRRELLRGLIEANGGYQRRGDYSLDCPASGLRRDIKLLLRSLGHLPLEENSRLSWSRLMTSAGHKIISIESIMSMPVRCIQVDSPSRLYLCSEGLVPTHNTFLMAEELRRAAKLAVRRNVGIENEIWYGAPTFAQAKRVMWNRLKKAVPHHWLDCRANETTCSMRLRSGHTIRIVGLDAFENLRGSGLWFFGGDEWADCRPEAWAEVVRPMLSTSQGHALFIGTPKGFDHFRDAYLLGQAGGDPSYRSFLFTTLDGGNVPPEEVLAAQRQLDPRTFRQEYGASFESYAGRVVYAFSRAESVRSFTPGNDRPLHVGMDFNVNPMSATVWMEDGDITHQIDEIILPTSNTDEMASELRRRYGRAGFDPLVRSVDHITVYPDPAGAQRRSSAAGRTDIGILREAGLRVVAMAAHPTVRDRTNVMNRQFLSADGARSAFVDPRCTRSIEAYERLVYREGSNEPDKSSGHDHLVDASGYYLFARIQRSAVNPVSRTHIMER